MQPNGLEFMKKSDSVKLRITNVDGTSGAESRQNKLLMALLLLIICFFENNTLQRLQVWGLGREIFGAHGLLYGMPEWRVYQNRLLGPLFVQGLALATGKSFVWAYKFGVSLLIALPNILVYLLVRKFTKEPMKALAAATALAVLVVAFQSSIFFYLWDAVDLTTMLVFAYAVFHAKYDLRILIPLFLIELLNRESAGFIALWIIVSSAAALIWSDLTTIKRPFLYLRMVFGAVILAGGVWWTHAVRILLFKQSFDPNIGKDILHGSSGEWLQFYVNLNDFVTPYNATTFAIALICCLAVGIMVYRNFVINGTAAYPVMALMIGMISSVWLFGLVDETRVWLEFVPFLLVFAYTCEGRKRVSPLLTSDISDPAGCTVPRAAVG
jgi:hypothetical protein